MDQTRPMEVLPHPDGWIVEVAQAIREAAVGPHSLKRDLYIIELANDIIDTIIYNKLE